jgi:hypothetical protein
MPRRGGTSQPRATPWETATGNAPLRCPEGAQHASPGRSGGQDNEGQRLRIRPGVALRRLAVLSVLPAQLTSSQHILTADNTAIGRPLAGCCRPLVEAAKQGLPVPTVCKSRKGNAIDPAEARRGVPARDDVAQDSLQGCWGERAMQGIALSRGDTQRQQHHGHGEPMRSATG